MADTKAWRDFRGFISAVEARGELKVVEGADCDLEIGTLTELMCERNGPMLFFDRINGFPKGYRVAAKPYATPTRTALALGLPYGVSQFEMFKAWKKKLEGYRPLPPRQVAAGPVMENVLEGDAVDLSRFPSPKWHEADGGAYLGTGCAVITKDPEEGWVNVGSYRCMFHDPRTTGIYISPMHHGNLQIRKWWAAGKPCPVAVAISVEPTLFCVAANGVPWGTCEYDYAGFLKGEPVEVLKGPRTGLPLPANAELVFEGEIPPPSVEERREGPFGEYTGYYAGGERMAPVIRVQSLYHRNDPILHGDPPLKPPVLFWMCPPDGSMEVWEGLEKSGLPGIVGVYALNSGGSLIQVVSIKQQYAGHARQVGRVASGLLHHICRMVIVVDEDIDPSNPEQVLWAMATRSDPKISFEIQENCPASPLDPMISPEQKKRREFTNSRALIVACRPWEWREEFPPVNRASEELRKRIVSKWHSLFD
ncbi:MAG TPA: UbiD family decarboxylase [Candidatus Binatia bacterium]